MAKTITFKPEFETKLKKLKIKTKFINNLKHGKGILQRTYPLLKDRVNIINDSPDWRSFVTEAFIWIDTPEKETYWFEIYNN
mgnify:CR=1 FL=1